MEDVDNGVQTSGEEGASKNATSTNTPPPTTPATPADKGGFDVGALTSTLDKLLTERLAELKPKPEPETPAKTTQDGAEVKTFTESDVQKRINSAIRTRLAEENERNEKKLESLKTQWLSEISAEFEKQKAVAVQEAIAARDFEAAKKSLQDELGITDVQVSRLQGKTIDELRADATALGFVKTEVTNNDKTRKPAPTISTGRGSQSSGSTEIDDLAAAVREGLRDGS